MKKFIHINQHKIRSNNKAGTDLPVITVKTYKENIYGHSVDILDKEGRGVASIIYSPHKPLNCGARVWIETKAEVVINQLDQKDGISFIKQSKL